MIFRVSLGHIKEKLWLAKLNVHSFSRLPAKSASRDKLVLFEFAGELKLKQARFRRINYANNYALMRIRRHVLRSILSS